MEGVEADVSGRLGSPQERFSHLWWTDKDITTELVTSINFIISVVCAKTSRKTRMLITSVMTLEKACSSILLQPPPPHTLSDAPLPFF